jgi:voltage-gated potassium channel
MKRRFASLRLWYKHSRYAKLLIYSLVFFFAAGILMVLFESGENTQFVDLLDGLWWTVITFSTTGYGDKVPITIGGRIIAVLTIFIGIGAMSLLSGALASWLVDRNTRARRGLMDFRTIRNHLVVCGWKADMKETLLDILRVSDDHSAEDIIVISNVDSERVEALKEDSQLKGLKFVRGDYFSELALGRANVREARKVLILADTLESSAASEVDSKTVMTVLTVKAIARDVYVTAEVLDRKFETYLRHAMCDEILFSRDFSRQMLASTSATNGMSHIVHKLLAHEGNSQLTTRPIPDRFVNSRYNEFRKEFRETDNRILLGVLENTGSPGRMKLEALREAQKTSDVSQLVTNLQQVKDLAVNRPVLLPPPEYEIQRHSLAIVLERIDHE